MILNIMISMRRSVWLQIKDDAKQDRIARRFADLFRDGMDSFYIDPIKSSVRWRLFEIQIKMAKLDDLIEFLSGYNQAQWNLVGVWEFETGLQLGQRFREKQDGAIRIAGTPTYPVNKSELLLYLPPTIVYDESGNVIISTPKTQPVDCHSWFGMPTRNYL